MIFFKNRWKLYETISKMEKGRFKHIRFLIGWSEKKLKKYLDALKKDGLIREDGGIYFPVSWKELINWDEMNAKKEDFND